MAYARIARTPTNNPHYVTPIMQITYIARLRCDRCGNKHYETPEDMINYKLIADVGLCLACVTEENED